MRSTLKAMSEKIYLGVSQVRVCVNCGEFLFLSRQQDMFGQILCDICTERLSKCQVKTWVPGYPHKTLSLYSWDKEHEKLVRQVAMGLKGGGPTEFYFQFAQELLLRRMAMKMFNVPILFVPAPGKRMSLPDHAESLALQLAKISGGQYWPGLLRIERGQQKRKAEKERKGVLNVAKAPQWQNVPFDRALSKVVFVDDIITSGSTAQSAYIGLDKPEDFEVWTIFHRPRLRERAPFAITHRK